MAGNPINPALLSGLLPGQTESDLGPISVGTSFINVALNNPERKSLLFVNLSDANIYINTSQNVSIGNGILLVPQGGSFSSADWEDFDLTHTAWYAIATAADSPLMVVEVVVAT